MRSKSPLISPTARARGLGSAKTGSHHWLLERITAVALIPLTLWFLSSLLCVLSTGQASVAEWLTSPCNALLMAAFVIMGAWHAAMGMQVVYDDYLHCPAVKMTATVGTKLGFAVLAAAGILAILSLHFGFEA